MNALSDEQLVRRYLKEKDERALEDLVKRYLPLIYGFARNYTGSQDNASDIAQEVFVKAWRNLKRFDQSKSFRTWLFTIAKRTAIDWLRKKDALPFSLVQEEGGDNDFADSLVDEAPSVFEQIALKETSRELATALARLPVDHAKVIDLHMNSDLNFRQIAEMLHEPLNTVKSRYRRGILLLKKLL